MKLTIPIGAATIALMFTTAHSAGEFVFEPGSGKFNWESYEVFAESHDYAGEQLTVSGPWLGPDAFAAEAVLAYFAAATGADVRHSGSDSFEQQIMIDVEAGSAPDVAVFPQPGLACDMAKRGFLSPLREGSANWMADNYAAGESWVALGTCAGPDGAEAFYSFPYGANVKSLVWFVPEAFEDAGYQIPETMEDLKALTDQIVADGETPWCIGLGSGGATGWPATDWVEDMMLRTQPPAVYDQWVTNKIPFNDARVIAAINEFGEFAKNDDYVAGKASAVATTDFRDSPKGLFSTPPQCYMHRQASFISAFFPDGVIAGADVDFFYFPAYASKDLGKPVLGAGTLFGITRESEVAHGLIEFLQTPIAHEIWMALEDQGFLTPNKAANAELYATDTQRTQGNILLNATTFRFDASDLMPGGIGAGAFWTGMVDYVAGKDASTVATEIQDSWDRLK